MIKNLISLFFMVCSFSINLLAQEGNERTLNVFENNKKWGFKDAETGQLVIPCKYEMVEGFTEFSLAKVKLKGKWGLIDKQNNFAISAKYDNIELEYPYIIVEEKGKYGLFLKTLTIEGLYSISYDSLIVLNNFNSQPFVLLKNDSKWGLGDVNGKITLPLEFDSIGLDLSLIYNIDFIVTVKNEKWGLVDFQNNLVYPSVYEKFEVSRLLDDSGNPYFIMLLKQNGKWGWGHTFGEVLMSPQFEEINVYNKNCFLIKKNYKWGSADLEANFIIPITYDSLFYFGNLYYAEKEGKTMILTKENQVLATFDNFLRFFGELDATKELCFLNSGGNKAKQTYLTGIETVPQFDYTTGDYFGDQALLVYTTWHFFMGGKIRIINTDGKFISTEYDKVKIPLEFQKVSQYKARYYADISEDFNLTNMDSSDITNQIYSFNDFNHCLLNLPILVCNNGLWGAISYSGKEIFPVKYKSIEYKFSDSSLTFFIKDSKYISLYDQTGRLISKLMTDTALSICNLNDYTRFVSSEYALSDQDSTFVRQQFKKLIQLTIDSKLHVYSDENLTNVIQLNSESKVMDTCSGSYSGRLIDFSDSIDYVSVNTKYTDKDEKFTKPFGTIFAIAPVANIPGECLWNDDGTLTARYENSILFYFSSDEIWNLLKGDKDIQKLYRWIYKMNADFIREPVIISGPDPEYKNGDDMLSYLNDKFGNRINNMDFEMLTAVENCQGLYYYVNDGNCWDCYSGIINAFGKLVSSFPSRFINGKAIVSFYDSTLKSSKFGVIDSAANIIIPYIYDSIYPLNSYGFMIFKNDGKCQIYDEKFKLLIKETFDDVTTENNTHSFTETELPENTLKAKKNGKWGVITTGGKQLLPFEYSAIYYLQDAWHLIVGEKAENSNSLQKWWYYQPEKAVNGVKRGFADAEGKIILRAVYDFYELSFDYNFIAKKDGKYGVVKWKGGITLPFVYEELIIDKDYERNTITYIAKKNGKWGVIDTNDKILIPFIYEEMGQRFVFDMISARKDGKMGYIDTSGNTVIPFIYDEAGEFYGYYAHYAANVKKEGNWGLVDVYGNEFIPCEYDTIIGFKNSYTSLAVKNGKYGMIDGDGKVIIPFLYEKVSEFYNSIFLVFSFVKKEGKWGVVNDKGIEIIPCSYDKLEYLSNNTFYAYKNGSAGILDIENKVVLPFSYKEMKFRYLNGTLSDNFWANLNGKWGIMNFKGKTILPFSFDSILILENERDIGYVQVWQNNKQGIVNQNNEVVLSPEYNEIEFYGNYCKIKKNGKSGIIWLTSKTLIPCVYDEIGELYSGEFYVRKGEESYYINVFGKKTTENDECNTYNSDLVTKFREKTKIKLGSVTVENDLNYPVTIYLYHSDYPDRYYNYWQIDAKGKMILENEEGKFNIGNDWGISIETDGVIEHCPVFVADVAKFSNNSFSIKASSLINY